MRTKTLLATGCVAIVATGCSGKKFPETIRVTGKVMHNGNPVTDAEVGFVPRGEEKDNFPAHGRTDESGEFKLSTYFDPDHNVLGARPGEYVVTVEKRDIPLDPNELQKHFHKHPNMVPKNLLPAKYTSAKSTDLKATVAMDSKDFEFVLTDDEKGAPKKK